MQNLCLPKSLSYWPSGLRELNRISLYNQIQQFYITMVSLYYILSIFSWKSPKKMLDLLQNIQNSPSPWLNDVPSLQNQFQVVVRRNDPANFQLTLN